MKHPTKVGDIVIAERPDEKGRFRLERVEAIDGAGKAIVLRGYPNGPEKGIAQSPPYHVFILHNIDGDHSLLTAAWQEKTSDAPLYASRSAAKDAVLDIMGISPEDVRLLPPTQKETT